MSQTSENFSVRFEGPAFDANEMPAAALAQSLLALDSLARVSAQVAYGKSADIDVKVKTGFRPGSFIVDLVINHVSDMVTYGAGAVTILVGTIQLAKWARGKKVSTEGEPDDNGNVTAKDGDGNTYNINCQVINLYNQSRTASMLSRLTQTLDMEGANSISLEAPSSEKLSVTKEERQFLRQGEGIVLTDNERQVVLEVVGAMLNGSAQGWKFSEGNDTADNAVEFSAIVEDDEFLAKVRSGNFKFANGTSVLVTLRTVQRKAQRTRTDRTIVEVLKVIQPTDE